MTQPWIVDLFLDCEHAGITGWRPGHRVPLLECPNATTVAQFKKAMKQGDIFFHAFPHNGCPDSYDASLFEASLQMSSRLAETLGVPRPATLSQRDETGMTRAVLPLLNKHGVKYVSLGSGGATGGHPVLPGSELSADTMGVFVWRDEISGAEVLMTADHGYGGGLHVLPGGKVALFCAWNRDNSGPSPSIFADTTATLQRKYPGASVRASTFDAFFAAADKVRHLLPVVTQEIGDTWLYGLPSDPFKNAIFREVSRRRAACIAAGRCNAEDQDFVRFDRLLTEIPEHTWGLDTTFYLADYDNWTNAQLEAAVTGANYRLSNESWMEQRSFLGNAIDCLDPGPFRAELLSAVAGLAPEAIEAARSARSSRYTEAPLPAGGQPVGPFHCERFNTTIAFDGLDGAVAQLVVAGHRVVDKGEGASLARVEYQTLSADNFSAFDADYGFEACATPNQTALEVPSCHNFAKPNMSSAYGGDTSAGYAVVRPQLVAVKLSGDSCEFLLEAVFPASTVAHRGAPSRVVTSVVVESEGVVLLNVSAVNKTRTRLAESTWVTMHPSVDDTSGWRLRYGLGVDIDPMNVVEHGATHLHALGSDGAIVHTSSGGELRLESLDVPVVSAGLLSPFPTPGANTTRLVADWLRNGGWRYNLQNNIWNT